MAAFGSDYNSSALCNGRSVYRKEYREMKRHLQSLNKPAVKSILTEIGDIFNYVNIYKQPAFDHPLLQSHTIEMEPSSMPKETAENGAFTSKGAEIRLLDGGCPDGTVPIRRVRMEDLLRVDSLSKYRKKLVSNTSCNEDPSFTGILCCLIRILSTVLALTEVDQRQNVVNSEDLTLLEKSQDKNSIQVRQLYVLWIPSISCI